jgi:hypothetical protein
LVRKAGLDAYLVAAILLEPLGQLASQTDPSARALDTTFQIGGAPWWVRRVLIGNPNGSLAPCQRDMYD